MLASLVCNFVQTDYLSSKNRVSDFPLTSLVWGGGGGGGGVRGNPGVKFTDAGEKKVRSSVPKVAKTGRNFAT